MNNLIMKYKSDKIIIQRVKYIKTSTKSVFNYKDFKIEKKKIILKGGMMH